MRKWTWLFCGALSLFMSLGWAQPTSFNIILQAPSPVASVVLAPDQAFEEQLLKSLKSGVTLELTVEAKVREKGWFGDTIYTGRRTQTATYRHRLGLFTLQEGEVIWEFSKEADLLYAIRHVPTLPLLEKNTRPTGATLDVELKLISRPQGEERPWWDSLTLSDYWEREIWQQELVWHE